MGEDVCLQEELHKVNVELKFMHDENENVKLEFQEQKKSLIAKFNEQVIDKDKELHIAHQNLDLHKCRTTKTPSWQLEGMA